MVQFVDGSEIESEIEKSEIEACESEMVPVRGRYVAGSARDSQPCQVGGTDVSEW
jgi:hypothetical protein